MSAWPAASTKQASLSILPAWRTIAVKWRPELGRSRGIKGSNDDFAFGIIVEDKTDSKKNVTFHMT